MIVSVIGETEKRPILYTLLKVFQHLGDVLIISNDRHLGRLIETEDSDTGEVRAGHFQNTFIVITDKTPDEAKAEVGYEEDDYEFIIYDNKLEVESSLILHVTGSAVSSAEEDTFSYLDKNDYVTIALGFGKGNIPYTANMFKNCELVEGKKTLLQIDPNVTSRLVKLLSPLLNTDVKTLTKVVCK